MKRNCPIVGHLFRQDQENCRTARQLFQKLPHGVAVYFRAIRQKSYLDHVHVRRQPAQQRHESLRQCECGARPSPAEKAAKADHRSLTALVEKLLTDYCRKKGFLKGPP